MLDSHGNNAVNVFIGNPGITCTSATVGNGLAASVHCNTNGLVAGFFGINVHVRLGASGTAPDKLLLAQFPTDIGNNNFIDVVIPNGGSQTPEFYVYGLANSGTATFIASADGYGETDGTPNVTLQPSGIMISGPAGLGGFNGITGTTGTQISQPVVNVNTALLTPGFTYSGILQNVAGGNPVTVNYFSSVPAVGNVAPQQVQIFPGTNQPALSSHFIVGLKGTSIITTDIPTGFSAVLPALSNQLTATIADPGLAAKLLEMSRCRSLREHRLRP